MNKDVYKEMAKARSRVAEAILEFAEGRWKTIEEYLNNKIPVVVLGVRSDGVVEFLHEYESYSCYKEHGKDDKRFSKYKEILVLYVAEKLSDWIDAHEANSV